MATETDGHDWVPATCALPTEQQPLRVAEFDDLFRDRLALVSRAGSSTLELTLTGGEDVAAAAKDLAARETDCCSFFSFDVSRPNDHTVRMRVDVPPSQGAVLTALFERASALTSGPRQP
jgi:hypothetical protein